jgi:hypothetical protein
VASANGTMQLYRVSSPGEPELLTEHIEQQGFTVPVKVLIIDQNGKSSNFSLSGLTLLQ